MDSKTRAMLQCLGYNLDLDTNMSSISHPILGDDYEQFLMLLYKYGANPNLNIEHEEMYVHSAFSKTYPYAGKQTVSLEAKFPADGFKSFMLDVIKSQDILDREKDEAYLRKHNPTAQRAYEEYQIILKLIK